MNLDELVVVCSSLCILNNAILNSSSTAMEVYNITNMNQNGKFTFKK